MFRWCLYLMCIVCCFAIEATVLPIVQSAGEFDVLYPKMHAYIESTRIDRPHGICRIFMVRHGESLSNLAGSLDGRTLNTSLSDKGFQQAKETAHLLSSSSDLFTMIYSSPMNRTIQTAEMIANMLADKNGQAPLGIIRDERLLEKFYGILEGASKDTFAPYKKKEEQEVKWLSSFEERFNYKVVEDMESMAEVQERVLPLLLEIAQKHPGEDVIVTTHNSPMKGVFMADVVAQKGVEVTYQSFDLENASVLLIESDGESVRLKATHALKFR